MSSTAHDTGAGRVFVTGAGGYVGTAVVRGLLASGHRVSALVRSARAAATLEAACAGAGDAGLDVVVGDLRRSDAWPDAARAADAVVHLAAQKQGNLHEQLAGTVATTDRLLHELGSDWAGRFVHASSFSVYDYRALAPGATLDERSPVYDPVFEASPYSQTKVLQERLVREWAEHSAASVAVLRIAGVYGHGGVWNQGMAIRFSDQLGVMFAPGATMKLVHLDNVVSAIVLAVDVPAERLDGEPINVVDDDLPSFRAFAKQLRAAGCTVPRSVPVPYRVLQLGERLLSKVSGPSGPYAQRVELLSSTGLAEGWLPLTYANERAKRVLGWRPTAGVRDAAEQALAAGSRA